MANKTVKTTGPVQWAKVSEQNRDLEGYKGKAKKWGGTYSIEQFLDAENEAKLIKAGTAKESKKNRDSDIEVEGTKYTFTRKHEGPYAEASGAPVVIKDTNAAWDFDTDGWIGNGSICEITNEIYPTKDPDTGEAGVNGTRLVKVKVLELVTYERQEEPEDEEIPF